MGLQPELQGDHLDPGRVSWRWARFLDQRIETVMTVRAERDSAREKEPRTWQGSVVARGWTDGHHLS